MNNWHTKKVGDIYKDLQTSEKGLTSNEAKARLSKHGYNKIRDKKKVNPFLLLLKQFKSSFVYILLIAAVISFIFHSPIDGYVILAIVAINAGIGYFQENKAEKAIEALQRLIVSYAKVYRNNSLTKIDSKNLVPGDIISLEEGDKIPADARLIKVDNLRTQEASLTGESFPESKKLKVYSETVPIGDQNNMVFMGTLVVLGSAKAVVTNTGSSTEIGRVATSIKKIPKEKSHYQKKVDKLAYQMALIAIIGAAIIFILGLINNLNMVDLLLFTIAELVAGIPEGLPAVLVVVLAIGSWRMAKRNALVRDLPSIETLGVVTVIATDKTGTLTSNTMMVEKAKTFDSELTIEGKGWEPFGKFYSTSRQAINPLTINSSKKLLEISCLCNKGSIVKKDQGYESIGDPTEVALTVLSGKSGLKKDTLEEELNILDDLPFNSQQRLRATLIKHSNTQQKELFTVGAFEKIISLSDGYLKNNKVKNITNKEKQELLNKAQEYARQGLRVLALAYKHTSKKEITYKDVNKLILVGIVGMKDPPRKEVKQAIEKAKQAGIRVIMNTGDHKDTAIAIAKEIGLVSDSNTQALTQKELEELPYEEFDEAVKKVSIFARVTPDMKLKIVSSLQKEGHIVAMTGDGVNDAPSLKKSDIGISMGIIGTDVARESSEIILSDDNFASIVNAIEEGRIVFRNVQQTSFFLITTNVAETTTLVASMIFRLPLPLLPVHLLYLNLVTDGVPTISLAMEPGHGNMIKEKPRKKEEDILDLEVLPFLLISVGLMVLITLPLYIYFLSESLIKAQTIAFVSMSFFQLWNVYNMRSLHHSIFEIGFFSNRKITWAIIISIALMLLVIFVQPFQTWLQFTPISILEFIALFALSSTVLIAGEIYKRVRYGNY